MHALHVHNIFYKLPLKYVTSLLLNAFVLNFRKLFCILEKFVGALKHYPYGIPQDHELHANEQNYLEPRLARFSVEITSISDWMAVFSSVILYGCF
jgi:hypothetical protein